MITLNLTEQEALHVAYACNREANNDRESARQMKADEEYGAMNEDAQSAIKLWERAASLFAILGYHDEARYALEDIRSIKCEMPERGNI